MPEVSLNWFEAFELAEQKRPAIVCPECKGLCLVVVINPKGQEDLDRCPTCGGSGIIHETKTQTT